MVCVCVGGGVANMERRKGSERTQRFRFVRREQGGYYTRDAERKEGRENHRGVTGAREGGGGGESPIRD